jgi:hypothetical protein
MLMLFRGIISLQSENLPKQIQFVQNVELLIIKAGDTFSFKGFMSLRDVNVNKRLFNSI